MSFLDMLRGVNVSLCFDFLIDAAKAPMLFEDLTSSWQDAIAVNLDEV